MLGILFLISSLMLIGCESENETPVSECTSFHQTNDQSDPVCIANPMESNPQANGAGTVADPYIICNSIQFNNIGSNTELMDKVFSVGNDLDFNCIMDTYTGIGSNTNRFQGTILGNNRSIKNFSTETDGQGALIRDSENLTVSDLVLENFQFSGSRYQGALVGLMRSGTIENVHVLRPTFVNVRFWTGGLVGLMKSGTIENSSVQDVQITGLGGSGVGGLVGVVQSGSVNQSFSTGMVKIDSEIEFESSLTGGLIGSVEDGSIENCFSTVDINIDETSFYDFTEVGGLVGAINDGQIISSYSTGAVGGSSNIGGFLGSGSASVTISNSFATGAVRGRTNTSTVGAFGGQFSGTVNDNYVWSGGDCDSDVSISGSQACNSLISNSQANITDFYDSSNLPLQNWDFSGSSDDGTNDYWNENSNGFPSLNP